jgi:carboxylesterase type B
VYKSIRDGDFNHNIRIFMGHTEMEGSHFVYDFDKALNLGQRYYPQNNYSSNISKTIVYNDINNVFIYNKSISDRIATAYTEPFNGTNSSNYENNLLRRSAAHAMGDYAITCPTILFGAKIVRNSRFKGKVFRYSLTYTNSKSDNYGSIWANVTHGDDFYLVFGLPLSEISNGWTEKDMEISREMIHIWTHFAKYGFVIRIISKISVEKNFF